jgi:hypothetical protein
MGVVHENASRGRQRDDGMTSALLANLALWRFKLAA